MLYASLRHRETGHHKPEVRLDHLFLGVNFHLDADWSRCAPAALAPLPAPLPEASGLLGSAGLSIGMTAECRHVLSASHPCSWKPNFDVRVSSPG